MNKKILIPILIILILLITVIFVLYNNKTFINNVEDSSVATDRVAHTLPKSKINIGDIPDDTEKLKVDNIETENFYKSAVNIAETGDATIIKRGNFEIVFVPEYSQFIISVLATPFGIHRSLAEQEFINNLGISQEEACRLNVTVGTPYFANPEVAGIAYGLSFCEDN